MIRSHLPSLSKSCCLRISHSCCSFPSWFHATNFPPWYGRYGWSFLNAPSWCPAKKTRIFPVLQLRFLVVSYFCSSVKKTWTHLKKVWLCFVCFLTSNVTSNPTTIVQPDSLSNESSDAHHGQTSIVQLLQLRLSEPSVARWICWGFLEAPGWPGKNLFGGLKGWSAEVDWHDFRHLFFETLFFVCMCLQYLLQAKKCWIVSGTIPSSIHIYHIIYLYRIHTQYAILYTYMSATWRNQTLNARSFERSIST